MRSIFCAVCLLTWCASVQSVDAQTERYDLGKRLRRFELAWQKADPELRVRSVDAMQTAVRRFFSLQLRAAAGSLDEAWFLVRDSVPPTDFERLVSSHHVIAKPRVMDVQHKTVKIELVTFYDIRPAATPAATVIVTLFDDNNVAVARKVEQLAGALNGTELDVAGVPAGEFELLVEVGDGKQNIELPRLAVSRVERLAERVQAIEVSIQKLPPNATATSRATLTSLQELLRSLSESKPQETDYPANRLLRLCDGLIEAGGASPQVVAELARESDVWLTLAEGQKQVPVRLRAPVKADHPLPVLLLLHGAGGSENMFFETYGAGRAVSMALDRGWLVVAPRQGWFGMGLDCDAIVRTLGAHFSIDRSRVFLVGHSMGATQVLQQFSRKPELPAAAAAIGGGNGLLNGEKARAIPWFVAAGQFDFGKSGAAALARSLERAAAKVTYREYKGVEHMVIVQAALDDLFAFLDAAPARTPVSP